ncbi:glycine cleavage system protein GcvH [Coraliomargarita akajimensis]|uniref:Glycine cleavage system H protein n=1 Tax=Coraliomargarita akajimensis (strain DSM 45221 / IAM 15411 / JCM 23193 / KCTC 12865 / 04OKA010-24) TaxID=583355 RepID=D5EJF5_CORAD|nr:glycine cleavage system protein GcvH [Coraliomargarita akajimensis]ADE54554.1 glycine cleavage system H protein [Coraliomargarita akajimensis DSM 45221]
MSELPTDLLFTQDHEWVRVNGDGTVTVGITDYAQESLGDITFVEFPDVGESQSKGDSFGVVESVKAASDLYMPLTGEILEVNDEVDASPELVNQDPYQAGWLLKVKLEDEAELDALLKPEAYAELI